jgi:hypothetical protein
VQAEGQFSDSHGKGFLFYEESSYKSTHNKKQVGKELLDFDQDMW